MSTKTNCLALALQWFYPVISKSVEHVIPTFFLSYVSQTIRHHAHAQLRVCRSLVTLLIAVSFSFNAFCFPSCTIIQTENMGHVIKSFTAKIFLWVTMKCCWWGNLLVCHGSSFYSNCLFVWLTQAVRWQVINGSDKQSNFL